MFVSFVTATVKVSFGIGAGGVGIADVFVTLVNVDTSDPAALEDLFVSLDTGALMRARKVFTFGVVSADVIFTLVHVFA